MEGMLLGLGTAGRHWNTAQVLIHHLSLIFLCAGFCHGWQQQADSVPNTFYPCRDSFVLKDFCTIETYFE